MEFVHYTVMGNEALQYLVPLYDSDLLIDCTIGEGGHSLLFLEKYPGLKVIGLDADPGIIDRARERLQTYAERVTLKNVWFDEFFTSMTVRPRLILLDLGISTYHYALSGRGFSFQAHEPLDMRLDASQKQTAADIVNSASYQDLSSVFFRYGEERYARRIAERIIRERASSTIRTSAQLAEIVARAVPAEYRRGRIHPATRTFQALRIAVNGELDRLTRALGSAVEALVPGGRIGVISFHSLEDRIVKNVFRDRAKVSSQPQKQPNMKEEASLRIITKKPLRPTEREVRENAASRSARFRVAEKL